MKKSKILSAVLSVLMLGTAAVSFTGCVSEDDNTLVMATNAEFPPYEYYDGDEIVGIDVEIAKAIAKDMGYTLVIEDMAFYSIIAAVQSGKADFAAAGMTVDEDRLKSVNFTDTYTQASQVIIVKEGSPIATPDDLVGKRIRSKDLCNIGHLLCAKGVAFASEVDIIERDLSMIDPN